MSTHSIFQDNDNIYFAMDLMTGGDASYNMKKAKESGGFTEKQAKFVIACAILGLEAMN